MEQPFNYPPAFRKTSFLPADVILQLFSPRLLGLQKTLQTTPLLTQVGILGFQRGHLSLEAMQLIGGSALLFHCYSELCLCVHCTTKREI